MRCVGGGGWFSESSSVLKLNPPTLIIKDNIKMLVQSYRSYALHTWWKFTAYIFTMCLFVLERKLSTETTDDEDDDNVPVDHDDATG